MIKLVSSYQNKKTRKPQLAKKTEIQTLPIDNNIIENITEKIFEEGEAFLYQEDIDGHTPIINFIIKKQNENFYKVINKYHIDHHNCRNITMLHFAVMYHNYVVLDYLLEHGANVNFSNNNKTSPLHTAVFYKDIGMVNKLIQYGADINAITQYSVTPLHIAYQQNSAEIVRILIENGAKRNIVDFCGCIPKEYGKETHSNIKTRGRKKKIIDE